MITRERWQLIKDLFHSALQQPAAERTKFISEACEGDESMSAEVESLISAHEEDEDFLNLSAYEMAAEMLSDPGPELTAGQQLGPYTILSSLKAGGMGEVYLAQDVRLGRKIALKLLPREFATDEQRVRRFEQEARAASALNHPNVCVIHEIGRAEDGRHFMAMEFIDGLTLRQRILQKPLTLKEALDVAAQVAWALEAAHAAGIVHRDIKPENIMLRRDGYVKVLDFGIAKLNARPSRPRNPHEASTVARLDTAPGTLIGTVKYMSPEQLREQEVDQRTDIWSLGVVLYEMVTGFTPFEADATNDIIAVILQKQPARLDFDPDEVPEEFQQLVRKALNKKRHERYQTIKELGSDLRELRRQVSVDGTTERSEQPTLNIDSTADNEQQESGTGGIASTILSQAIRTADYVLSEIKQHKTAAIFTGVTAVFALLFIGVNLPGLISRWQSDVAPLMKKMEPFTNSGKSICAAISPDRKYIAHAESKNGLQELLVASIVTSGSAVVVPPGDFIYRGITFSRDSNYLYFTRSERSGADSFTDAGVLYQLALPGSPPRKIKNGVDSPITFSPNGDRFSFVRFNRASGEYSLIIASTDGAEERTIATRRDGNRLSVDGPAWSPDEKTIVCGAGWWDNGYHMHLIEVDLENGREKIVGGQSWFSVYQAAWFNDKSGLIISAREQALSPSQLFRISYPQGESVRITNDITEYQGVSLSLDGSTIVSVERHYLSRIWIAPDGDVQRARSIASKVGLSYGLNWTSKGKIVFSSMAGNNLNILSINPDGSDQRQLTVNAGDNYTPAASPDGRFIVFASNRNGSLNIWRMNAEDGGDQKQLTFSDGNSYPSCSPDGQWVLYDNQSNARTTVWKVPIDGGAAVEIVDKYSRMPVVSPDNQFIACRYYVKPGLRGIAIVPFQGGLPVKLLPIPIVEGQQIHWANNGHSLTYMDTVEGASNIWSYDLDTGATRQLTNFKTDQIFAYAWSPDYKELACERWTNTNDVTLISIQR